MSPSIPIGLAIAMFAFAAYMHFLAKRSAAGAMGRSGPGIRIAETTRCEHTWAAAQQVAGPVYRRISAALAITAAATLALAGINALVALIGSIIAGLFIEIFFLGVASVRARKAAEAVDCEHTRLAKAQRAKAKHGKGRTASASTSTFSPAHRRTKKRR
jgi:hypothetical protein